MVTSSAVKSIHPIFGPPKKNFFAFQAKHNDLCLLSRNSTFRSSKKEGWTSSTCRPFNHLKTTLSFSLFSSPCYKHPVLSRLAIAGQPPVIVFFNASLKSQENCRTSNSPWELGMCPSSNPHLFPESDITGIWSKKKHHERYKPSLMKHLHF